MTDPSSNSNPSSRRTEAPTSSRNIGGGGGGLGFSGHRTTRFAHTPDSSNPDAATLREQWRYAIKLYSRWYSHAWGTAILAGVSFFALGWVIKGENPIHSMSGSSAKEDSLSKPPVSESGS
uniref:Uncharacterized protein n=1 Tax=Kalanchoe fedtschenkoi TaxID=63787 RepID=A0A7N0RFF4_KALFE